MFSNASTHSHAREVNAHVALDDDNIRSTNRARENSAPRLIRITIILPPPPPNVILEGPAFTYFV